MAHIPQSDVNQIWNQMGSKNWDSFQNTLQQHKNQSKGIDNSMVEYLLKETKDLKGQPFPNSPDKLYKVLNDKVEGKDVGKNFD